jgi:hypothetical protein
LLYRLYCREYHFAYRWLVIQKLLCHVKYIITMNAIKETAHLKVYRTVILTVVLYGREIWSLTMGGGT